MVAICYFEKGCVQELTFVYGSVLRSLGWSFFFALWSQQVIILRGQIKATLILLLMNGEKDSVVNFLTPTKLITSSLKPKSRLNANDSLFSHSSKHRPAEDPARNYNSQFDRLNYGFNRSQEEVEPARPQLHDSREAYSTSNYNKNYAFDNPSKAALKSEDNFRAIIPDRIQTRSQHPHQSSFVLYKVQNTNEELHQPEPFTKLIQNSGIEQMQMKASHMRENRENRQPTHYEQQKRDFTGYTQGLTSLIIELKSVKVMIEGSLGELQYVLDNTSKFLQSIDEEYARIKQRVLDYTSQVLDAGFTRYRQNMVNWAKYEEVEVKTQVMLQQLDKTIREDEVVVQEMNKLTKNSRIIFSKQTQLNEKIELYTNFVKQLARSKAECLSMRPQLKKDRILTFEEAITALADF